MNVEITTHAYDRYLERMGIGQRQAQRLCVKAIEHGNWRWEYNGFFTVNWQSIRYVCKKEHNRIILITVYPKGMINNGSTSIHRLAQKAPRKSADHRKRGRRVARRAELCENKA